MTLNEERVMFERQFTSEKKNHVVVNRYRDIITIVTNRFYVIKTLVS